MTTVQSSLHTSAREAAQPIQDGLRAQRRRPLLTAPPNHSGNHTPHAAINTRASGHPDTDTRAHKHTRTHTPGHMHRHTRAQAHSLSVEPRQPPWKFEGGPAKPYRIAAARPVGARTGAPAQRAASSAGSDPPAPGPWESIVQPPRSHARAPGAQPPVGGSAPTHSWPSALGRRGTSALERLRAPSSLRPRPPWRGNPAGPQGLDSWELRKFSPREGDRPGQGAGAE